MLTVNADIETAMNTINEAGVYKFILKPWDDNNLKVTLKLFSAIWNDFSGCQGSSIF
jgi:response regulator RpfG family c-di-GMP phosphodiesterase